MRPSHFEVGGPSSGAAGSQLAASAEVERLPVRTDLADSVTAARAGLTSFHMDRHERPVLLGLVVIGVGEDRLDGPRQNSRYSGDHRLLFSGLQRSPPPERQQARLEQDLVRVRVADAGQELLV